MGHRGTFVTEDRAINWPNEFIEKWKNVVLFRDDAKGVIASKYELKYYENLFKDLLVSIQRVLKQTNINSLPLIYFHECGGVTKFLIEKEDIKLYEPFCQWKDVVEPSHYYCYGCWEPEVTNEDKK